jgi:hypothetical protein
VALSSSAVDFVLETNNNKYNLHFAVMANLYGKSRSVLPPPAEFHIDLDDPTNIFDKFSRLFRGERVTLTQTEGKFYKRVTEILDIEGSFPAWMRRQPKGTRGLNAGFGGSISLGQPKMPKTFDVVMTTSLLIPVLCQSRSCEFTLGTVNKTYSVNRYSFF